jgi:hypothetical protein
MSFRGLTAGLTEDTPRATPGRIATVLVSVLIVAVALTWTFLGMRAVMDVGGSCAEGGPYEIAQPCPNGALLLSAAIPVMVITAMLGTVVAMLAGAPNLLIPMWGALFGSLGWNFLEYGFSDDGLVWGWIVCGVVFELMALPAIVGLFMGAKVTLMPPTTSTQPPRQLQWYLGYLILAIVGLVVGSWSFDALS